MNFTSESPDDRNARNLPSLLIPYWDPGTLFVGDPGDRGDGRPLPGGVVSYLCEGITTAAPYQPGQPLTVTVAVRNWGGGSGSSLAMVKVWWEYPATSFASMNASRLVGVASVEIPPRGATEFTEPMTYTFSKLPPPHICLVACVDHLHDAAPRGPDPARALLPMPGVERHWAQHNLSYVTPNLNGIIDFSFMAGNAFQRAQEFVFDVRPFTRERLDRVLHTLRAEVVEVDARVELRTARDLRNALAPAEARHPYALGIEGGRRTQMHLRMRLAKPLRHGQVAVFEVLQRRVDHDQASGGIALVVVSPEMGRPSR